jgi:Na+:H+ antiporter, NhaA family
MRFANLFQEFFNSEKSGGLVLLGCTIISLVIANSGWGESYAHFWHQHLDLSVANVKLDYSVEHWINDGLMTVFFLLVGLEIEREIYIGELSDFKNATLPIAAAVGGMLLPALLYLLINRGTDTQNGFGIPMATDIAFALGMLALLGKRIPFSLKIFLTALAIIDDLGAILIIAIFYNTGISWGYLGLALGIFGFLLLLNRLKIGRLSVYLILGVVMWYCMLQSGVHATLSGVLLAFAIPFGKHDDTNISYRLQHFLHKPVAYVILPLFALANTGILLSPGWFENLTGVNSIGILVGLVIGKPLGIGLFAFLLVWLGWGKLPEGTTWKHIIGAGLLGGIGFTMSIFISNLAFNETSLIQVSKIAVLMASLVATLFGLSVLATSKKEVQA